MNIVTLAIILFSMALNCIALDTILNPYRYLNYNELNVYSYDNDYERCDCNCNQDDYEQE